MSQKLRRVVTIVIVFGVIWGGLTLLLPKKKKAPEETPPAPTPTWVEVQPGEGEVETLTIERLKAKLPTRNNDFGIVYFEDSEQFGVTIFQGNFEEQKQKALSWFSKEGVVNPQDLAILWSATRWVTE